MLGEESKKHHGQFNDYVKNYRGLIEKALTDEACQDSATISANKHLNYRLQQVIYLMDAIEV